MKRWKFSTLFLFAVLVVGSVIYFSDTGYSAPGDDGNPWNCDPNNNLCCNDADCAPPDGQGSFCVGAGPGDNCDECGGLCEYFLCCQGPGCDPYCDYPGCDPFNSCETCGDGFIDPWEDCDDNNLNNGDGCDDHCIFEECGNGVVQSWPYPPDGNGVSGPEECDDGNTNDGDGCSSMCQLEGGPWCGNGEECVVDTDCDDDSTVEVCINGYCVEQEAGEECEDGNLEQGDGCFECQLEIDEQYQCTDSQRILKISSLSNAHAELWNGSGNYTIEICFDEIFGFDYNGQSPQECTGTNTVLRLADGTTSETNAHAERREGSNPEYGLEVCYGDLVCVSRPADEACDEAAGEREVVSLSADTNAHLETNDSDQYISASEYKVCCFSGGGGNARWEKPLGLEIIATGGSKISNG